ncbi:hypothetical protein GGH94_003083 [Coemansia aciculifera]|uniref:Uncharacterized protein n=1 Tax=Coemansia aciculifera TaxID=417176 RepID=A0A9W8II30_9FUNG|nr:hypothetical protein GGH94_003083 [Coemansia aciculifera]KAJ2873674.1 hypothetical protein GGH93_003022 [Coemansia aciculifera]
MIVTHLYTDQIFEATASIPWKLNMTAASSRLPWFVLALRKHVHVYSIDHYTRRPEFSARLQYPGTSLHHQWCWAVRFVYPFYFVPDSFIQADSNCESIKVDGASSDSSSGLDRIASQGSTPDTQGDAEPTDLTDIAVELAVAIEALSEAEFEDGFASDVAQEAIDHSADMENGHERDPTSSSSNKSGGDADSGVDDVGYKASTSALPSMASPLLLCGTERDILLLDPANSAAPVVSSIVRATSRNAFPVYAEMPFDRLTFLEWVPELAIVVAGSFSGNVALVGLRQSSDAQQPSKNAMQVLAHLPAEAANRQLYGVVVYRHTLDIEQSKAVTLLLTFIDGTIMAYELRNSLDNESVL